MWVPGYPSSTPSPATRPTARAIRRRTRRSRPNSDSQRITARTADRMVRAPRLKLDLAAARKRARPWQTARHIRHHDARGGLAPVLARFFNRLVEGFLDCRGELADRVLERIGLDFKTQWQHAGGRQQLRLTRIQHTARGIGVTVDGDRNQPADGASLAIGKHVLAI